VTSGPPTAQIVIVHCRQIIVHQGINVHELNRAGGRLDLVFVEAQSPRGGK